MNSIELAILAYIQARKRFDAGYKKYIALCESKGNNSVVLSHDIEPFVAMNEALFWAFSLYEKQDIKAKIKTLNNETIGMMSGLKYIINVMKHCNDVFSLFSFSHPAFEISVKVEDINVPVIHDVSIKPSLSFGVLNDDFEKDRINSKRRLDYVNWLQVPCRSLIMY